MKKARPIAQLILGLAALVCLSLAVVNASRLSSPDAGEPTAASNPAPAAAGPKKTPRNILPMDPDPSDPFVKPNDLRGTPWAFIMVRPDRVDLQIGERVLWTGFFRSVRGFDGSISLEDVTTLVASSPQPDWLRETEPGVFLLQAALTHGPGTSFDITAPRVKQVRMMSRPYVYIAGIGAKGTFRGVSITSWRPEGGGPDTDPTHRRPFVVYQEPGARFDAIESEFSYLGSDSSRAYGVSWGLGTTGEALRSVFHHNLFGAYTSRATGVAFRNNVFRDNDVYGLDPHTSTRSLIVTNNESYGNKSHGIIFSEDVTDGIVKDNYSHDNGENGIMMDESSGRNVIENNVVENNTGDGIVIQGSSQVLVKDNTVSGNNVGIRVNANELGPTVDTQVKGNQLMNNQRGIEVYGGARNTTSQDNVIRGTVEGAMTLAESTTSQSDTVDGGAKGVVVVAPAVGTMRSLTVLNVLRGVVLAPGAHAIVQASQIAARETGVDMDGPAKLELTGAPTSEPTSITGARRGVVVRGTADLHGTRISDVERGVHILSDGLATIEAANILARKTGVDVELPGKVRLEGSDIRASDPVVGAEVRQESSNELVATPTWLAIAGALFVLLALMLHFGHRMWSPTSALREKVPQPVGGGRNG